MSEQTKVPQEKEQFASGLGQKPAQIGALELSPQGMPPSRAKTPMSGAGPAMHARRGGYGALEQSSSSFMRKRTASNLQGQLSQSQFGNLINMHGGFGPTMEGDAFDSQTSYIKDINKLYSQNNFNFGALNQ